MNINTLNLAHLKYFVDSVEALSLTAAADLNFVTRPAVSQAIKKLGEWYNSELLTHEKKKFQLTKAGESFYPVAKNILKIVSKELESRSENSIKIGCSSSLLDTFLIPAISKMKKPELQLKLGASQVLRSMIEDKKINLALLIDEDKVPSLINQKLYTGEFVLVGNESETIICTEDRPEVINLKRALYGSNHNFIQAESWGAAKKLATALNAMCLIPDFLIKKNTPIITVKNFKSCYEVTLVKRKNEFLSESEMKLCNYITKLH